MIDRRAFMQAALLAALSAPLAAEARSGLARRIPRIGVLGEVNPIPWTIRTSLAEIECCFSADGHRLPDLAARLCARDVDVLVALGAGPARAARNVTRSIPIVFVVGTDAVADGLVDGAARPGTNLTGLVAPSASDTMAEAMAVLRQAIPHLRRIGTLSCADNAGSARALAALARRSARPPVELCPVTVRSAEEIEAAVPAMRTRGMDALLVLPDALFSIHASRLVELAAQSRLPAAYGARAFAEAGGLIAAYGDTAELIRRTAAVVARIVAGAPPAALPVQSLAGSRVALNLGTARALGLALPPAMLGRAQTLIHV